MAIDLMELLNCTFAPVERSLSKLIGESQQRTRCALRVIAPIIVARLMHEAASPAGAAEVFRAAHDVRIDPSLLSKIDQIFTTRASVDPLLELGDSLTTDMFGHRTGAVMTATSQLTAVRPRSALTLLALSMALLFTLLRVQITTRALNPATLASLLFAQSNSLRRAGIETKLLDALGFGSLASLLGCLPDTVERHERYAALLCLTNAKHRSEWWWALAPAIAAACLVLIFGKPNEAPPHSASQGSRLTRQFAANDRIPLASSIHVYFDADAMLLGEHDRENIARIAQAAKQGDHAVVVIGYVDRTGDPARSLALAEHRAVAVKDALVAQGIVESHIIVDPPTSIAEESRRVDIEVR